MKILFVAGCVEPGKSGVGDYTRLLAAECVKQGNSCAIASINDLFVSQLTRETLCVENGSIELLRWHEVESRHGLGVLGATINSFSPDWISLQFVPYAFESRGLIWPRLQPLAKLLRGLRIHVMFHELWIGEYSKAPWKEKIVGAIQQVMIRWFVKKVSPLCIHTSTHLYQKLLHRAGIPATILPMFGTVRTGTDFADKWLFPLLQDRGICVTRESRSDYWLTGFFGSIHPEFAFEDVLEQLRKAAIERKQTLVLLSIGTPGPGLILWDRMAQKYRDHIHFVSLGHQSEERVSQVFNAMDLGLSSTPLDVIGKSSSVAAMLEHGLPVLVMDDGSSGFPTMDSLPPGIFSRQQFFMGKTYLTSFPRRQFIGVTATARQFLSNLDDMTKLSGDLSSHATAFASG